MPLKHHPLGPVGPSVGVFSTRISWKRAPDSQATGRAPLLRHWLPSGGAGFQANAMSIPQVPDKRARRGGRRLRPLPARLPLLPAPGLRGLALLSLLDGARPKPQRRIYRTSSPTMAEEAGLTGYTCLD